MDYQTEEQQVEAFKKWWDENGTALVVGAILAIGGVLGWQYWQGYTEKVQLEASDIYNKIITESVGENNEPKPIEGAGKLFADYSNTAYATLISFRLAKEKVDSNNLAEAEKHLREALRLAEDDNLKHIARTRLARILNAQEKADEALALLKGVEFGPYKSTYELIRGNSYSIKGDKNLAAAAYIKAEASKDDGVPEHPNLPFRLQESKQPVAEDKPVAEEKNADA